MFWRKKKPEETLTVADLMEYGREEAARLIAIEKAQYAMQQEQARQKKEQERLLREQERQDKEQRKQAEQLAKHERRIADLEFRVSQAEADILTEQEKLDHYAEQLIAIDERIASLDRDIELFTLGKYVDKKKAAEAEKAKLNDRAFSITCKVRASEKRLATAQHRINMSKMELAQ